MTQPSITGRYQLAELGRLLSDPARAGILLALMDGTVRPAGELARMVRISASTASAHLKKLTEGGLVSVHEQGRHRYFRLANEQVAQTLETLGLIHATPTRVLPASKDPVFTRARTCYDHLAGRLGVALFDCLREHGDLALGEDAVQLSSDGLARLVRLGVITDPDVRCRLRQLPGQACVDWTERRFHLGGRLGAALTSCLFEEGLLTRRASTRALIVTGLGRERLTALGVAPGAL